MYIKTVRQAGVTLVELIIAMVIIGIAGVAVVRMIASSTSSSTDPVLRKQALLIAEGLMEEVQTAYFTYCDLNDDKVYSAASTNECSSNAAKEALGPEAGNARPFDNINDYFDSSDSVNNPDGIYSFTNAAGVVVDANGDALTSEKYVATVTVNPVVSLGPAAISIQSTQADMRAILITIQVRYGNHSDEVVRLDSYRTRYAPNIAK